MREAANVSIAISVEFNSFSANWLLGRSVVPAFNQMQKRAFSARDTQTRYCTYLYFGENVVGGEKERDFPTPTQRAAINW